MEKTEQIGTKKRKLDYFPAVISHDGLAKRLKRDDCAWQSAETVALKVSSQIGTLLAVSFGSAAKGEVPTDDKETVKVAGFDLDSTRIKTKSGALFAKTF